MKSNLIIYREEQRKEKYRNGETSEDIKRRKTLGFRRFWEQNIGIHRDKAVGVVRSGIGLDFFHGNELQK